MALPPRTCAITYQDYLAALEASPVKLEFHNAEIFAMAGGTVLHARLGANVIARLAAALRGQPCRAFHSELRIAVGEDACFPDASVVCGHPLLAPHDCNAVTNPSVLVEVLSPSTEMYDRGDKFALYRRIATLGVYLLVHTERNQAEHIARNADRSWTFRSLTHGELVRLTAVPVTLDMSEVYADAAELRAMDAKTHAESSTAGGPAAG
jgi:Uma2 family endonuclease